MSRRTIWLMALVLLVWAAQARGEFYGYEHLGSDIQRNFAYIDRMSAVQASFDVRIRCMENRLEALAGATTELQESVFDVPVRPIPPVSPRPHTALLPRPLQPIPCPPELEPEEEPHSLRLGWLGVVTVSCCLLVLGYIIGRIHGNHLRENSDAKNAMVPRFGQ